jgi:hypothetical protein
MKFDTSFSIILLLGVILFGIFFPPVLFLVPLIFFLIWERYFATTYSVVPLASQYTYRYARPRSPPA